MTEQTEITKQTEEELRLKLSVSSVTARHINRLTSQLC
jgi:hypothetical protein